VKHQQCEIFSQNTFKDLFSVRLLSTWILLFQELWDLRIVCYPFLLSISSSLCCKLYMCCLELFR